MTRLVVDASVITKLFAPTAERHHEQALAVLESCEQGTLALVAPELIYLEVLNTAARKWLLEEPALQALSQALVELEIDTRAVDLERVGAWSALGLTAYDAAYVAVAEAERLPLCTDDADIVRLAPGIAVPLAGQA